MKRIATVLIFNLFVCLPVMLTGCGGDNEKSSKENKTNDKQTTANNDGATNSNQEPVNKNGSAGGNKSGDQTAGRVRTASFFAAGRLNSDKNMLKQIALALHMYHDVNRCWAMYPAGVNGGPANEKLSWRVKILPFLEHANLFEEFDLKQPWDSTKNKPLIEKGKKPFTLSNGNLICAIKHEKQPKSFRDLADGSSNTFCAIENPNADGEQWSQPKDITIQDAVKLLKSLKKGEFILGAMYDGSVHQLHSPEGKGLTDEELAAPFDYKDGTPINEKIFEPSK